MRIDLIVFKSNFCNWFDELASHRQHLQTLPQIGPAQLGVQLVLMGLALEMKTAVMAGGGRTSTKGWGRDSPYLSRERASDRDGLSVDP